MKRSTLLAKPLLASLAMTIVVFTSAELVDGGTMSQLENFILSKLDAKPARIPASSYFGADVYLL
jgi:hypothetical protein